MMSDRGISASLAAEDVKAEWFAGGDWLHLSGYSLFSGGAGAAVAAARLGLAAGARVSVDLSAATLVSDLGAEEVRRRVAAVGAEVVFANQAEAVAVGELDVATMVIKRGAAGCTIVEGGRRRDVAARAGGEVRDTTGAGDALAAGWLVGGVEAAMAAAAACVGRRGAMPPQDAGLGS
jgi:sugar/nucleoside kinase (ribokinase family)